jgi:hypothetical protein
MIRSCCIHRVTTPGSSLFYTHIQVSTATSSLALLGSGFQRRSFPFFWSLNATESVTTDGRSASLSWNKAPIWGLRPDFYYCQTVACLSKWRALSDERTGRSFTIATGAQQRSHSRVRVPYLTVSDSRLPFSSSPTTRTAYVEVFDRLHTGVNATGNRFWRHLCTDHVQHVSCEHDCTIAIVLGYYRVNRHFQLYYRILTMVYHFQRY